jgi:hypothetical protein
MRGGSPRDLGRMMEEEKRREEVEDGKSFKRR